MKLDDAHALAEGLVRAMRPYCERVEIAGSIRRRKAEVKDIELVSVPRWEEIPGGLFDEGVPVNTLYQEQGNWITGDLIWLKGCKPEGRYWQGELQHQGIKLDLFLTTADQFGLIYLIRTGSAEFSEAVVTHGKRIGRPSREGWLRDGDERIPTPEEADVFTALRLEYVEPHRRTGKEALRTVRREVAPR